MRKSSSSYSNSRNQHTQVNFHHRFMFLLVIFGLFISVIFGFLYYYQIYEHKHYNTLSETNRIKYITTLPTRGNIYDRNGNIIAKTIIINNAGINQDSLIFRMKYEDWHKIIQTNLNSNYQIIKSLLPNMLAHKYGKIIGISSIVGTTGNPGQANYAASKAGMVGMSKSLAFEVASRGITVNIIAPGVIETPMTNKLNEDQKTNIMAQIPAIRMGTATEIASAALYLASSEASYLTGATLHINGGMAMV